MKPGSTQRYDYKHGALQAQYFIGLAYELSSHDALASSLDVMKACHT